MSYYFSAINMVISVVKFSEALFNFLTRIDKGIKWVIDVSRGFFYSSVPLSEEQEII